MSTDPIADAIAALKPFAEMAEGYGDGNSKGSVELFFAVADLCRAREVRLALLSAQGQAGKPVGWRPIREARHGQPNIVLWFASTRRAVVPNATEWWTWEQQPTLFCELPSVLATIKGLKT